MKSLTVEALIEAKGQGLALELLTKGSLKRTIQAATISSPERK